MNKKKFTLFIAVVLLTSLSFQSCIGSFSLTNRVLSWNRNVNNKFVNELVFFAFWILPVYEVTAVADLLVLNSIEFWSGNKPLEANNKIINTPEGDYMIAVDDSGYKVLSPFGDTLTFSFDANTQTWSFCRNDNTPMDFLKFIDDSHVQVLDATGSFVDVEISREGVDAYKASMQPGLMANI